MRILAIERELPKPADCSLPDLLRAEAVCLFDLVKRDVVRDIWCTKARDQRTIIMLECSGAAEARKQLAALPLVQNGLIEFTVHELKNYDGFERLLGDVSAPTVSRREEPPEY